MDSHGARRSSSSDRDTSEDLKHGEMGELLEKHVSVKAIQPKEPCF